MQKNKFLISVLIAVLFTTHLLAVEKGDKSPVLIGEYLYNTAGNLNKYFTLSQHLGKTKVVNMFYTNCIPCFKEIPKMAKLESEFPDVIFTLVNVYDENRTHLKKYLAKLKAHPKRVIISGEVTRKRFKNKGDFDLIMPATFIIDGDNIVQNIFYGYNKYLPHKISQALKKS